MELKELGSQEVKQVSPSITHAVPVAPVPQPATPPAGARITLKRNGLLAESFAIGHLAVIGRFDSETGPVDVDLGQLPEAIYVSRHHAEIQRDASGGWAIKDLGGANGTFVRPKGESKFQRISGEQAIHDGDEFALGNARFEFRIS
jgi:pSer/pThr/pTyr-binding forkhead associated (FHA) protein